jgi:S-(hydroxymethyl)glutathione dehydrogenase / alcohol dehydrogenase
MTAVGRPMSVEDVEVAAPSADDVVVDIAACGVCHSDQSAFTGLAPMQDLPVVLGHEACGTVSWVGSAVTRFRVGDRVVGSSTPACFECAACERGQPNLCQYMVKAKSITRLLRQDGSKLGSFCGIGGFAEQMVCNPASLVQVHTDLPEEQLCLIGCGVNTGMGAVFNRAHLVPGDTIAIIGCGGIGLCAVQAARISGASQILAIDPVARKRDLAVDLGACAAIDPSTADVVQAVLEATAGQGVDATLDIVGQPPVFQQAYAMTRRGGRAVLVGAPSRDASFELGAWDFFYGEKSISSSLFGSGTNRSDFARMIKMAELGQLDLASLVSGTVALHEVPKAFAALDSGSALRTVVMP